MLAAVTTYSILKMFHVLFAVLWVGGAIIETSSPLGRSVREMANAWRSSPARPRG